MASETHPEVDLIKQGAINYGIRQAHSFQHEPTIDEIRALDERARKEWGKAYLDEAAKAFDDVIDKIFPQG